MELNERIEYIMKLNQLNASAFAERIGVQPSSVSHILSGRNKPSLEFVQKIITAFPKVDTEWLISGKASKSLNIPKEESNTVIKKPIEVQTEVKSSKKIQRILIFYSDNSFEEFHPSSNQPLADS